MIEVKGQSIHHTSLSIGTGAVIEPVFGTSVKVTVFNGFHTVTIFMDCAALEKIFQAWQAFDPIPF